MKTENDLYHLLKAKNMKVSFAESCTGGMASSMLVNVPGSSEVFDGAVCCYSNDIKIRLLGVNERTLQKKGAVSADCALQMAKGALKLFGADIAVSVTGIAGPGGGTDEKPAGTVYIGCALKSGESYVCRYRFAGGRNTVRKKAAQEALHMAILAILQGCRVAKKAQSAEK